MATNQAWRARPRSYIRHTLKSYMGEAETIIGVVAFVVIFVTVSFCWVRTHKRVFTHIDKRNEHALLNEEHMADAHERKEQRNHERDTAKQKRIWDREDHEHERSQRTSARTQPHNEHHKSSEDNAAARHSELLDLFKNHHAAPVVHESGAFGFGHIPAQARTVYEAPPHETVFGSIRPSHASGTQGGSNVLPDGWQR